MQPNVSPPELAYGLPDQRPQTRPAELEQPTLRFQRAVAFLLDDEFGQASVVEVDQRRAQVAHWTVDHGPFVPPPNRIETCRAAPDQAQLIIGKPACVANDPAHQIVVARDPESATAAWLINAGAYFGLQFDGDALVGIDKQHPLAGCQGQRRVTLGGERVEGSLLHSRTKISGDLARTVTRGGVDEYQAFVRELEGAHAIPQHALLVSGNHCGRQARTCPRGHETSRRTASISIARRGSARATARCRPTRTSACTTRLYVGPEKRW